MAPAGAPIEPKTLPPSIAFITPTLAGRPAMLVAYTTPSVRKSGDIATKSRVPPAISVLTGKVTVLAVSIRSQISERDTLAFVTFHRLKLSLTTKMVSRLTTAISLMFTKAVSIKPVWFQVTPPSLLTWKADSAGNGTPVLTPKPSEVAT